MGVAVEPSDVSCSSATRKVEVPADGFSSPAVLASLAADEHCAQPMAGLQPLAASAHSAVLGEKLKTALLETHDEDGTNLLLAAAAAGVAALVRSLLSSGVCPMASRNAEGENALHLAARGHHREAVLTILENSDLPLSGPNAVDRAGRTPLDVCSPDFREEVTAK